MEKRPRIVIAANQGRSGKTTITLGLLKALKNRGLKVQPFKKGPDYIDPSWHSFASGIQSRNLDAFMMTKNDITNTFVNSSNNMDISIIEGAMGLFDGLDVEGSGSTAEIAYMIDAPIILVVNCQRMTRSVAALVNGVVNFDPRIKIAGVILNNVARKRHENILKQSIEKYCNVPVLGIVPKSKDIVIPDRHLGLIPAGEKEELLEKVDKLGKLIEENIDLDKLIEISQNTTSLESIKDAVDMNRLAKVKIGVIKDKVFSFYYPENLEALEEKGAELVIINSLNDAKLPEIDGLYIGGGFPEVFAEQLERNEGLKTDIKNAIQLGMPVYAECGGLMYLGQKLFVDDNSYEMVGALPYDVKMEKKPQGHGYTINKSLKDNPFTTEDTIVKGHEFHNSRLINLEEEKVKFAFEVQRGKGIINSKDGILFNNCLVTYMHTHAASTPEWADGLLHKVLEFKNNNN
ncbi:hydrogenobyrinic acid a,c-diamide synthase (glutamine-hydrolysing) [Desulfonispora thiosulfatigenes DSM 11270]|uniref:Cobyrinate a,c-diamide synthase n=1 Tax=Desulfonispora thiosulfatigenes DSM 11270 TaxID=656914 RepID=A0A1W1UHK7_DESTI|nr:cobyrinate a,c-diamide synthase [Desulfonispora thiosulfatigenes]SMB80244.1 hydrogenobyrinic acid a,c-diamide synthase (glutamine-hydrolysing) [Desulfonispora thiosulfatigenes DSM 11270]